MAESSQWREVGRLEFTYRLGSLGKDYGRGMAASPSADGCCHPSADGSKGKRE